MKTTKHYELNGYVYTIESLSSDRWQMTVWDAEDHDSYGITDPNIIIKVLTQGVEKSIQG